ncbi:MAG: YkvA family protein [Myxococcales bacterium]
MSAHPGQSYFADAGLDGDAARPNTRVESRPIFESVAQRVDELPGRLSEIPLSVDKTGQRAWKRQLERWSKRVTIRNVVRLVIERRQVKRTLQRIPVRMQLVTNQIRLTLELIDDFVAGSYRQIPWHSMALAAGAILYSVSPADLVPDALPMLGTLDDLIVLGIALRLLENDLRAYAASKGYDPREYFAEAATNAAKDANTDAPHTDAPHTDAPSTAKASY